MPARFLALATTVTASGGAYDFTGLYPGNYIVAIDPNEFGSGGDLENQVLTSTGADYTNDNPSQVSYKATLTAGQDVDTADFGFTEGLIGDFIWRDDDGDGTPDPNEPGISGVTVTLYYDKDGDGVVSAGIR